MTDRSIDEHGCEAKRARTVQTEVECAASDTSSIDLSTDPSQHDYNYKYHYKPVTREEWVETLPKKKSKRCDPVRADNYVQKPKAAEELLDELLTLVRARDGKERRMRRVVQELKSTLRCQKEQLTKDCPVGEVSDEIRSWCTGASGACSECGMNHFGVDLHRIGNQVYGATTHERNKRVTQWLKDGTEGYVRSMRKTIKDSWLGQLLTDITVKREVHQVSKRRWQPKTQTQVRHRNMQCHTHTH